MSLSRAKKTPQLLAKATSRTRSSIVRAHPPLATCLTYRATGPNYLLKEEAFFLLYAEHTHGNLDEVTVYAHLVKDKCSYPIVRPDWRPGPRGEAKIDVEAQHTARVQQAIDVQSQIQEEEAKKREEAVAQERERRRQTTRSAPQARSQNTNTMTKMSLSSLSSRASQTKSGRPERPRGASRSLSMPYPKMRSSQQASQTNEDLVLDDASLDLSTQDVETANKKVRMACERRRERQAKVSDRHRNSR